MSDCEIDLVGKERNGTPRYWCRKHFASATGAKGERRRHCELASKPAISDSERLRLDPNDFPGGVALWGALPPVYNTANEPVGYGVHVHGRKDPDPNSPKQIDDTYKVVEFRVGEDLLGPRWEIVTTEAAISFFASLSFGLKPKILPCSHCNRLHLDADIYAVRPHRKHLCHFCGRDFYDEDQGVGNPLVAIKKVFGDPEFDRVVERSTKALEVTQKDYAGGIALWASNPAAFWTVPRSEHSGVHLHGYDSTGRRSEDETFGDLRVDGQSFVRMPMLNLMTQRFLSTSKNDLISIDCPRCGHPHFDQGEKAVVPHREHECESCSYIFQAPGGKATISNPLVGQLQRLYETVGK